MTAMSLHKGFTLVELAIVITIIGLLIGGVLKGQELLQNARMTSVASQVKGYNTALTTFRDVYKALPGDMPNPTSFLEGCTVYPCSKAGNGDGAIMPISFLADLSSSGSQSEDIIFWVHLAKANLISGFNANYTTNTYKCGEDHPASALGGCFKVRTVRAAASGNYPALSGIWLGILNTPDGNTTNGSMDQSLTMKLDLKSDDGRPYSGDLIAFDYSNRCPTALTYDANQKDKVCNPAFFLQN